MFEFQLRTGQEVAGDVKLVRVMPNVNALVGEAVSAICLGDKASVEDSNTVQTLFSSVGKCFAVDESQISAVCGVAGSSPAYVFMLVESIADGGVRVGMPRELAQAMAAQAVLGSGKMILESGRHPGALKDMVASPAGRLY